MSHVDYSQWLTLIKRCLQRFSSCSHPRILEMGGGTATLGFLIQNAGFRYFGSDISVAMCRRARCKGIRFFAADARSIPVKPSGDMDMVVFLYDGINYLSSLSEYVTFFREAAFCLREKGLVLFDISTRFNSRRYFLDNTSVEDFGESFLVRQSWYQDDTSCQHNNFTIFSETAPRSGVYKKYEDPHIQRLFHPQEIARAIPRSLFSILGIWDGFSFHRYTSRSERIHFLLRKQ